MEASVQTNTTKGLLGILGIWLTAGIALPLINILNDFSPTQLMTFRGYVTALLALLFMRGVVGKIDLYTKLMMIVLPLATLGLFQGVRYLGAGPTIIIITATPIVNFCIGYFLKRPVRTTSVIALFVLLLGVVIAQWSDELNLRGLAWACFGMVMSGVLYELFARTTSGTFEKCLCTSAGMGTLGLLLSLQTPWPSFTVQPELLLFVVLFAFVGGFLYWIANMWAFDNLPTNEASILAQGETPAVIIGAYFLLGEQLTLFQWFGVGIALCSAYILTRALKNINDD